MNANNKANERNELGSDYNQRCLYLNTRSESKPASNPSTENKYATKDTMAIPIDVLRNLDRFAKEWFIVADLNVLFNDISFLRSYIVGDPTCQLLTPISILNKIDAMCATDPCGVASAARQALAQMEVCARHVRFDGDVEPSRSPRANSDDDTDEILRCCLNTMSHGYHVVLVTRSRGLYTLAEIRGVYVYDVQQIKHGERRDGRDGRHLLAPPPPPPPRPRHWYRCIRYTPARGASRHGGDDGGANRHGGGARHGGGGGSNRHGGGVRHGGGGGANRHGGGDRHGGGGERRRHRIGRHAVYARH